MTNRYIIAAAVTIAVVFLSYFIHFYMILGYKISNDSAIWAQLGDYAGGILNPILSFISIVLLIKSLTLQNQANLDLRREIKNNEKTEKLKSFESIFFNMINSQKYLFDTFRIEVSIDEEYVTRTGVEAVIEIENAIEARRENNPNDNIVQEYLDNLDAFDQIFGITRTFYIMVKMISEKLSDSHGFNLEDRNSHFLTLLNFTDFAQLRLIMICVQFMDFESVKYLKNNDEFKAVLDETGLSYELY
ncbi:hypothetical protein [Marinobacterium rhizophilum]|uniref:hypothetical protein n=1 Tax=Marinobacterium rhizophilum TaxID=420402 RepID=UPI00037BB72B|nr:hypothetical protein [Marinobacterium rhizophilum]